MRLIYLADTHIRSGIPENRRDEFLDAITVKLAEVLHLCRQHQVDFIIHGGDIFDNPRPDQRSLDLFRWFLRELGLPAYCVAGNHDLIDQRLDSLEATAIGGLARQGLIKLLQPGERLCLADSSCVLQLSGQHFSKSIDRQKSKERYMVKKKSCDVALHVTHGMLLPKAFSEKVPCTLISEVISTEADFTLGAHAHLGYQKVVGNKHFLNPGALARLTNLKQELLRRPKVLFMEFNCRRTNFEFIPLASAQPGPDILDQIS
ncbi:MAG: metallophosphoesterase [Desulfotomaculaceae bacterium]|nr:metallophosphoesterase [Desulfotomaculaceae bacterium]MDD4766772.1 metallophosphoesterase [Desulfotomaculaceae bacterium]